MIALNSTVLQWYQQQTSPPLAIFKNVIEKRRKISIHEVVNLNAGGLSSDSLHEMSNTLNILKLRRQRQAMDLSTLCNMGKPHEVTGSRIFRAWRKANRPTSL